VDFSQLMDFSNHSNPLLFVGFFTFVIGLLALDLGVFHKKGHVPTLKESIIYSLVWVGISMLFNAGIWYTMGSASAVDFLTCYVIEKSLSVDNLFVFLAIFTFFGVKGETQHKVLYWGIIGAFVIRALFIGLGAAAVQSMGWVMYIFGAFLLYKGYAMWSSDDEEKKEFDQIWPVRMLKKIMPQRFSTADHNGKFVTKSTNAAGKAIWAFTPLAVVLIVIEFTDVVFAVDSIPAIIGISKDPFMLITSNVMAILGLRAMYFVLAAVNSMFCYLQRGMCLVLGFIGLKMIFHHQIEHLFGDMATWYSLGVIGTFIGGSIVLSMLFPKKAEAEDHDEPKKS